MYNNENESSKRLIQMGDLWMANLPKREGSIQCGKRPVYIWSGDINNKFSPTVNVIPLTSRLNKVYPMHVLITTKYGLLKDSYTLPEQITTIMKDNLSFKIGECDEILIKKIEDGILIHKGMSQIYNNKLTTVEFDESRAYKMAKSIQDVERLLLSQKSENMINFLKENYNSQVQVLKAYCNDFGKNIERYYNNYKNESLDRRVVGM